jgi:hypothetical protein
VITLNDPCVSKTQGSLVSGVPSGDKGNVESVCLRLSRMIVDGISTKYLGVGCRPLTVV